MYIVDLLFVAFAVERSEDIKDGGDEEEEDQKEEVKLTQRYDGFL